MIQIRNSVFETNSSSTHSVSIAEGTDADLTDTIKPNENGEIVLTTDEYGWEVAAYSHVIDRLSYATTYAMQTARSYEETGIVYNFNHPNILLLIDTVKEHTGATSVKIAKEAGYREYGYIDHQSEKRAAEIFKNKKKLEHFLFNPESEFSTNNDNY